MPFDMEDAVRPCIVGIGRRVTSEDIDTYDRLEQVSSWAEAHRTERNLRWIYALTLLILLTIEIMAVLVMRFLIGFRAVEIDKWVATAFNVGTFGQVSSMAFCVNWVLIPVAERRRRS